MAGKDDAGWLFTGRADLMRELIARTSHQAPGGVTLVSGRAGCGKSTVLARLVTLSDPDFRVAYAPQVADIPTDLLPRAEAVDVAVLAIGKNADDVLAQLLHAFNVPRSRDGAAWDTLSDRIHAWDTWLAVRSAPVTIVLDALDEARDPAGIVDLLTQLSKDENQAKVRLLIGVRSPGGPHDPGPAHEHAQQALADQIQHPLAADRLRIDEAPWWQQSDVRDYVLSVLTHTPGSPYTGPSPADAARQIADVLADENRSGRSFLIARLAAAQLTRNQSAISPTDPAWLKLIDEGVVGLLRDDLTKSFPDPVIRQRMIVLLRAVAFAFGRGLPWGEIWPLMANAVADTHGYGDRDIADLLVSPIAAYLITDRDDDTTVYRLFHDALRTTLREQWHELADTPGTSP